MVPLIAENQKIAMEAGGIEVVLEAMNKHVRNGDVCLVGCASLALMVRNNCK